MESAEIWFELGNTYNETGLLDKAAQAYLKAMEQKLLSGNLYSNLAAIYVQQGKLLESIPLYQKSLEFITNPKELSMVWGRIGNVYHQLNEYGKSIQAFQKADDFMSMPIVEKSIREADAALGMANNLDVHEPEIPNENPDNENEFLKENANVWNELGLILFKVGAYDDAIDAYKKAIELEPEVGYLYSNLGQVFVIQGKLAEAIDQYEKSLKLLSNNKDKAVSWTRLGDIYRQLDQNDMALPAYQLADVLNQTLTVYTNEYRQVNLDTIISKSNQVRGMEDIGDLVLSIRRHGIIQPLIVCSGRNEPGKYILIAGRRRLEAARMAGLKEVPVIVRRATNQEILELSINENIHSSGLNPFELAKEYRVLANEYELTIEEISSMVGRSCHSIANTMKMLEIPEKASRNSLQQGCLSGQSIINHSLAEIQIENSQLENLTANQTRSNNKQNIGAEVGLKKSDVGKREDSSPTLWYLDSEKDVNKVPKEDEISCENSSLLARARHVLKSNPHPKRSLVASSYRV